MYHKISSKVTSVVTNPRIQEPEGVVTVASNLEVSYAANRQISISKVQHDVHYHEGGR
jgi:hypothetical protein